MVVKRPATKRPAYKKPAKAPRSGIVESEAFHLGQVLMVERTLGTNKNSRSPSSPGNRSSQLFKLGVHLHPHFYVVSRQWGRLGDHIHI